MCNGLVLRGAKLSLLFNLAKEMAEYFFVEGLEKPEKQSVNDYVYILPVLRNDSSMIFFV